MKRDFIYHMEVDARIEAERARLRDIRNLTFIKSYGGRAVNIQPDFSNGLGSEPVEPVQEDKPTKLTWLNTFIGTLAEAATCALVVLGVLFVIIEVIL
jgi:hypothetical protein